VRLNWLFLARGKFASESESSGMKLAKEKLPSKSCESSERPLLLDQLLCAFGFASTIATERFIGCSKQGDGSSGVAEEPSC
jgi:hypothetical protein